MAELAMLADIQWMVYPEVTCQLHIMAQARESLTVVDQCSNHSAMPPSVCAQLHPIRHSNM